MLFSVECESVHIISPGGGYSPNAYYQLLTDPRQQIACKLSQGIKKAPAVKLGASYSRLG